MLTSSAGQSGVNAMKTNKNNDKFYESIRNVFVKVKYAI